MKNIKIKYNQLLFLYAYLRLIDLSLDRSKWTNWKEFQDYFKNIPAPSSVAQYVLNSFKLPEIDFNNFSFFPEEKLWTNRLRAIFSKTLYYREDDILYCYKLLYDFNSLLNSDNENYHLGIEKLRLNIARYYSRVLGRMILWKDLDRLMSIEHFFQNEHFEHLSLSEVIPDDFYKT
ncbi:hypothetical protein VUJ46_17045 [Chryseobacterium sp. MYb264]|uniref:hypothetical protein n=1 Tax=Chryseobacterium sp. MYb264 TaxID=2745153 RepID=UPI002E0FB009|nr:hypothetical protein VUJ46_17045 [Chryseobacterium sp. MYb264]